jgi:AhpD family alkylhydroperoxidase
MQQPRIDYPAVSPEPFKAMLALEKTIAHSGIEHKLLHLIKLRVSQINGCAFCIDMHWKDLRALGENEPRLYGLNAWRETPLYSDRERAALEWAEAVTLISNHHVDQALFDKVAHHFNDKELADLTWAIAAINTWNRIAIPMGSVPGNYRSPYKPAH